jgi:hypothetical protein
MRERPRSVSEFASTEFQSWDFLHDIECSPYEFKIDPEPESRSVRSDQAAPIDGKSHYIHFPQSGIMAEHRTPAKEEGPSFVTKRPKNLRHWYLGSSR